MQPLKCYKSTNSILGLEIMSKLGLEIFNVRVKGGMICFLTSPYPLPSSQGAEAPVYEGSQREVQAAGVRQQGDEEHRLLQVLKPALVIR